jgi:beta-glucosidase
MKGENTSAASPAYLDPNQPVAARFADLLVAMTLPEKIGQMCHRAQAIPRLGIPDYNYANEALHGVARNGRATVFPQVIGLAATWDPALIRRVGSAIGDEARAKYHAALRSQGEAGGYQGLTFWSPNVNIFRDPRWGRGQETWGEDPFLTGEMAAAFVAGLQGDDPRTLKAAACAKHYAVHSGPEALRHSFDAIVSRRDLHATYLPAFRKLVVEAGVEAVMGAYNRTNGEPCCASQYLIEEILRGEWGFAGHFVSDCGALDDFHQSHHVTADAAESAALALQRGCDLECGHVFEHLPEAIARGLVTEADVDRALARTLATRFKLGMFDPPDCVPYASIPPEIIGCAAHRDLAYEAAVKSVVLLKNAGGLLPLPPMLRSVQVVGPTAATVDALLGNYSGLNEHMTTLVEGIAGAIPEGVRLEYRPGCQLVTPNVNALDGAPANAAKCDVTIACMGLLPTLEGEEGDAILSAENGDRSDLGLPAVQQAFIKQLALKSAKVVLVLTGGSPIALGEAADLVQAIVFVWYPGQEGGRAVADVLFGRAVPSGRLPVTFPRSVDQLPPFQDYAMRERTYRYASWEPLYPFGFGLSYTCFVYSDLMTIPSPIRAGESLVVRLFVTNAGAVAGEEVVQLYLSDLETSVEAPIQSLVAIERVALAPGEQREVTFAVTPDMMMLVDDEGRARLEPGQFRLTAGGCSPGTRGLALGAAESLTAVIEVVP